MDFKTQLVYQAAKLRLRKIERYTTEAEDLQRAQLRHILSRARGTELGERYDLGRATDYRDFAQRLPLVEYDAVKGDIERMIRGERDVLVCQVKWHDQRPQQVYPRTLPAPTGLPLPRRQ